MTITIDGPAGAGKSTISKKFAHEIDFSVLDTGAMYRCVALLYTRLGQHIDINDSRFQQELKKIEIHFEDEKIFLNNEDVSHLIRTSEIDMITSKIISVNPAVRKHLVALQQQIGEKQNIVAEGRDMGTNVFTQAPLKFYLTANTFVRAKRRYDQLLEKNIKTNIKELEKEIELRDHEDCNRALNPLCIPEGAVIIDTSELSISEVLEQMINKYNSLLI